MGPPVVPWDPRWCHGALVVPWSPGGAVGPPAVPWDPQWCHRAPVVPQEHEGSPARDGAWWRSRHSSARCSPRILQLVPTRRRLCAEIKVSCLVAGKCKCCRNKLLIVKPHYLGVIITGTPCTAKMRPRVLWSWAPKGEDVPCLRAGFNENY